jgi:hypothetical protein
MFLPQSFIQFELGGPRPLFGGNVLQFGLKERVGHEDEAALLASVDRRHFLRLQGFQVRFHMNDLWGPSILG